MQTNTPFASSRNQKLETNQYTSLFVFDFFARMLQALLLTVQLVHLILSQCTVKAHEE